MSEENIVIEEEELPADGQDSGESWTETIVVASHDVLNVLRQLSHEASVRRVVLRTRSGRTLLDIPVYAGVFGVALMGYLTFIPLILAFVTETSIVVERRVVDEDEAALLDEIIIHEVDSGEADDLQQVKGIGPKAAELLSANGITTYRRLAATSVEQLRELLDRAGARFRVLDPSDWPAQAAALAG